MKLACISRGTCAVLMAALWVVASSPKHVCGDPVVQAAKTGELTRDVDGDSEVDPGDTITYRDKQLFVNGERVESTSGVQFKNADIKCSTPAAKTRP